jgi:streptomycin 6-kinase
VHVPELLVRAVTTYGGRDWLVALPSLVGSLAEDWSLTVGEAYEPGGVTALALRVQCADGTPAVLKVRYPDDDEPVAEGAALRHFGGRGAVALLAEDEPRTALLLERCDPGTPLLDGPDDECARVVAGLLGALWSPAPEGDAYEPLSVRAARWIESVEAARDFDAELRDETLGVLRDLAVVADDDAVVLHGDLHAANVLRAAREPWLAIDPKGRAGDRTYDCAALLRDRATPETVPRRFAIVREVLGVDPERVRGWALAQAAEGAVWSYRFGDVAGGDEFAEAARLIARLPG